MNAHSAHPRGLLLHYVQRPAIVWPSVLQVQAFSVFLAGLRKAAQGRGPDSRGFSYLSDSDNGVGPIETSETNARSETAREGNLTKEET